MTFEVVTEETLPAIIEQEIARSVGHWDGTLALARKLELDYYNAKPFGNETEGESQVISTDVADTIEGMLPEILEIFTASDDAVRFDPEGPEDEEKAKQMTEVANYVFYRQNNGFLVLYEWFKDAMIQKNGVVKYWWEDKFETTKESYQGLTENEYQGLLQDPAVKAEILEKKSYDDPQALAQLQAMKDHVMAQAPPGPGNKAAAKQVLSQFDSIPVPQLYDCTVKFTRDISKICIQAIPPEEFGISAKHMSVSIQDAPFCYHRSKKTISELRTMGCPEDILEELKPTNEPDITPESLARDRFLDMAWRDDSSPDDTTAEIWVVECFMRIDFDGDDIAELRHIIMPGRRIWINEETDHINFAALTPIIMPHRWTGKSVSEMVMDIQFTKSTLIRQMLNNLYLTNNPRKAVLSTAGGIVQANLDDLLVSRSGAIMREYVPNAIRNEEIPFVAGAAFPMIEYLDATKEARTGQTRYNQGTDADSLNKTARGIALIQGAGQKRLRLIARIFAETGVKDLFRGIVYMLSRYSSKAMTVKLRNKWTDIDPREWKNFFNMTVNVGLGTGNRDVQLAHLSQISQEHVELMQSGRGYMVSDENIYNLYTKKAEALGFKHPELFISDPQSIPPEKKQPPPPPELIKIQAESASNKEKNQLAAWKEQFNADLMKAVESIRAQAQIALAQMDNATKERIAQMNIAAQTQVDLYKHNNNLQLEAVALDSRKDQLQTAEQVLQLKKNLDSAINQEKDKALAQNDKNFNQLQSDLPKHIEKATAPIKQNIEQMSKQLRDTQTIAQQAVQIAAKPKNEKIKIGKVTTDKDGRITDAEIVRSSGPA